MERTWKPTTVGILTISAGCYGIGVGAALAILGELFGGLLGIEWLGAFGAVPIAFGIVAIIGGIFALRRRIWGLALAGTILALPLIIPGTVMGILSLIFLVRSRKEFS